MRGGELIHCEQEKVASLKSEAIEILSNLESHDIPDEYSDSAVNHSFSNQNKIRVFSFVGSESDGIGMTGEEIS